MFKPGHIALELALAAPSSLLMLTLFDSNAWWKSLLFALAAAAANTVLSVFTGQSSLPNIFLALGRGVTSALLAFLLGLTPFFRTTFGTLVGFAFLLTAGGFVLNYFAKE